MSWHAMAPSCQVGWQQGMAVYSTNTHHSDCKSVGLRLQWFESTTCHAGQRLFRVLTTRSSQPELSRFVISTRAKLCAAVLKASGCECT